MILNISLIVLLLIIFGVMIVVWRKIMTENLINTTKHLDDLSHECDAKEKKLTRQLEEAKLQAQDIVATAQIEAEKLKKSIITQAEAERDATIKHARAQAEEIIQQADKSRQHLLGEIDQRIDKGAVAKAVTLIDATLPQQFKREVHAHWVEDLIRDGFSEVERLHIPEGQDNVKVISAFALSESQHEALVVKINSTLGRELSWQEEVDPSIVAGVIISIGSLVLDGSFKNKIQENARG